MCVFNVGLIPQLYDAMQNKRGNDIDYSGLYRGLNAQDSIDGFAERAESVVAAESNMGGKVEAQLPVRTKLKAHAGMEYLKNVLREAALDAEVVGGRVGHEGAKDLLYIVGHELAAPIDIGDGEAVLEIQVEHAATEEGTRQKSAIGKGAATLREE